MSKIVIDYRPPRGRISCTPTWHMSAMEKVKAMPGRKRFKDRIMHFELTEDNIAHVRAAFPQATHIGYQSKRKNLVDGPRMSFKTALPPNALQVDAFNRARGKKAFAFFEKPGSGKTKMMLDHAVDLWCAGEIDALFVFSYSGVHEQWILDEIPKHVHSDIPWAGRVWYSGKKPPEEILRPVPNQFRILAMNYEAYAASDKAFAFAREFAKTGAVMAAADESQRLKSDESVIATRAVDHREDWTHRVLGSGEPTPLGIEDYYKQFCFLDPEIIGCWTMTGFKGMFCRMGGYENTQVVGYQNQEHLHRLMAPYVHVGEPDIAQKQIFETARFNLGPRAREAYDQLKQELMVEVRRVERLAADVQEAQRLGQGVSEDDYEVVYRLRSVLPMQAKLLEIACGRLTTREGEVIRFEDNRLERAMTELDIYSSHKCILWSPWTADHALLAAELGDKAAVFNGQTSKKERRDIVQSFLKKDGGLQYIIGSTAAMGTGWNLQGSCFWNIYYSNRPNAGERWQSERRTYRLGIDKDVRYTDIIARNTVDVGVANSFRRKRGVSDMSIAEFRSLMEEDQLIF